MNLFESDTNETRQQRLALTWSGKNESAPAEEPDETTAEEPVAEEQAPVEDLRPRVTLTKATPVLEPVAQSETPEIMCEPEIPVDDPGPDMVDECVDTEEPAVAKTVDAEAEPPRPMLSIKTPATAAVQPMPVEDEPERPTLSVQTPLVEAETRTNDTEATPAQTMTGEFDEADEADEADEVTGFGEMPDEDPAEAATYVMATPNPAELSNEFAADDHDDQEPIAEKDAVEMEEQRKVTLTKAAVIPDPEDMPVSASASMKVEKDDDKTCSLKPRLQLNKSNTCRLKPDTSKIVAESLGGKLRAARELAGMSEFELAEKTRISSEYITALENEAFVDLPLAPIYVKSYLKTLSRQFGLNADELIVLYEGKTGELKAKKPVEAKPEANEAPSESGDSTTSKWLNRSIAAAAAALAVLLIAGVLLRTFGGSKITDDDLQAITNAELCDSIRPTYLPARHLPIPGRESSVMNEY